MEKEWTRFEKRKARVDDMRWALSAGFSVCEAMQEHKMLTRMEKFEERFLKANPNASGPEIYCAWKNRSIRTVQRRIGRMFTQKEA